jgi:hypothetical protein
MPAAFRPRHPADVRKNIVINSSTHVNTEIVMLGFAIQLVLT